MKHNIRRIISLASVLVVGSAAIGMFAGCTTQHPEVTITYSFNGKNYSVRYVLSRNDAPRTVQHFLELADAGFYDDLCVHDFEEDGAIYSGGYYFDEDGELQEVDYLNTVKRLEEEKGITFTQSVWKMNENKTPLYTVYGEFKANNVETQYSRENRHSMGALVMYYTDKGKFNDDVWVERADGGKNNDGKVTEFKPYKYNSATSLFYTYTGSSSAKLDNDYCVFGMANEDQLKTFLDAIKNYIAGLTADEDDESVSFTEEIFWDSNHFNQFDDYEEVRHGDGTATYQTPVEKPIIIKSVKVNKY